MKSALLLILLLSGCASIDLHTPPPAGWPVLAVTEHNFDHAFMRDVCMPAVEWYASPEGCAWISLSRRTCDLFMSADFPDERIREHELLHCKGYDHPGETVLVELFQRWKEIQ